jgi:gamma-glutamylcyclotransferase (GGCT)/AIG2-like uncharacterized protein YtfP
MHYVFVYGSLLDPARVSAVIGRTYEGPVTPASLLGFVRRQNGYFYLVDTGDQVDRVDGALIGPFSDEELARLDRYEGCPELYIRHSVDAWVDDFGDRVLGAWTYVGASIAEPVGGR